MKPVIGPRILDMTPQELEAFVDLRNSRRKLCIKRKVVRKTIKALSTATGVTENQIMAFLEKRWLQETKENDTIDSKENKP
jgi:hypothetical protein